MPFRPNHLRKNASERHLGVSDAKLRRARSPVPVRQQVLTRLVHLGQRRPKRNVKETAVHHKRRFLPTLVILRRLKSVWVRGSKEGIGTAPARKDEQKQLRPVTVQLDGTDRVLASMRQLNFMALGSVSRKS